MVKNLLRGLGRREPEPPEIRDGQRLRTLVAESDEPVVLTDPEGKVIVASPAAALEPGHRLGGEAGEGLAYEELRSGFTAVVSHELRTPLARLLALLETALLPEADSDELVE